MVVIIMFASTVSLISYSNFRKGATVRTSAEKVRAILVNARTRAIASNQPSSVLFDLDNSTIWIDDLDNSLNIRVPKAISPELLHPDVVMENIKIGAAEYDSGQRRVVFQPDGTNSFVTINLRRSFDGIADDENYFAIQMYPTSAEPKVWPKTRK